MKVANLPADAKRVFDNLFITPSGEAFNFIPKGTPFRNTVRKKDLITKYTQHKHKAGYWTIKYKGKEYKVHRLIATAFIPNPENLPYINHMDSDRTNNKISNLEWCTPSHNLKHAYRSGERKTKPVNMYTKSGIFVKRFNSIIQAAEAIGVNKQSDRVMISQALRGVNRVTHAFGMKWEYA